MPFLLGRWQVCFFLPLHCTAYAAKNVVFGFHFQVLKSKQPLASCAAYHWLSRSVVFFFGGFSAIMLVGGGGLPGESSKRTAAEREGTSIHQLSIIQHFELSCQLSTFISS